MPPAITNLPANLPNATKVRAAAIVLGLGLLVLAGCSGTPGADVSGKVTFAGKPVPRGRIYFSPDVTKENDGPQGYAEIRDGEFDTRKGGGRVHGGPTVVLIRGYDGAGGANSEAYGKRLFKEFTIAIDLPKENSTRDFDVPAAAAEDLKDVPRPQRTP